MWNVESEYVKRKTKDISIGTIGFCNSLCFVVFNGLRFMKLHCKNAQCLCYIFSIYYIEYNVIRYQKSSYSLTELA